MCSSDLCNPGTSPTTHLPLMMNMACTLFGLTPAEALLGVTRHAARALKAAYKEAFGKDTALIRVGGSIPVAVDFQEAVGAPLVISGIAQADSAIHSPNEHLVIDNYHRGIEAVIRFVCGLA